MSLIRFTALQINFSCPNTGHEQKQDAEDIIQILRIFHEEIPQLLLIPKFDLLVEPETISKLKPYCDAFCVANTLAFGKKQSPQWWSELFKDGISPLPQRLGKDFPGGLSGAPLFPILVEWLTQMQSYDPEVIIIAGGGIMKKKDIKKLSEFSIVHGVALGSVAILRPWRLRGLIKYGNKLFQKKQKN
jgi:dihydroorotate dehydrogenase